LRERWESIGATQHQVAGLGRVVAYQAFSADRGPIALPRGDIRNLCEWMESREDGYTDIWRDRVSPLDRPVVRDAWGRPLIYRFPSLRKEGVFDLYSVGPNGVDEMGEGDDISCGGDADFAPWASRFKGGIVDVEWVRAHLGNLERDPSDRKIIGAPPERLRDLK